MRIADADGLIKHFENVVDVKFFTPANVITIIKTFSGEVEEGHAYTFRSEDGKTIITDLNQKAWLRIRKDIMIEQDLISREEAKNCIQAWLNMDHYYHPESLEDTIPTDEVFDTLNNVPPFFGGTEP